MLIYLERHEALTIAFGMGAVLVLGLAFAMLLLTPEIYSP